MGGQEAMFSVPKAGIGMCAEMMMKWRCNEEMCLISVFVLLALEWLKARWH